MHINTPHFGPLDIDPETILTFPEGLAGLPHLKNFKLLHEDHPNPIVHWLQSLDDLSLTFNVIDPALLGIRFELTLSDSESQLLEANDPSDLLVLLMVGNRGERTDEFEANARLPVVINPTARKALQKARVRPEIVFRDI